MPSIHWKFSFCLGLFLGFAAAIGLLGGLFVYLELFHSAYAAAATWLAYFTPINLFGGFVVGVLQGIVFSVFVRRKSPRFVNVIMSILFILTAVVNAYGVWTVGVLTLLFNVLVFYWARSIFFKRAALTSPD